MFGNECLGELAYEGTTAAVFLAGLFLSFLVDYCGARFVLWRQGKKASSGTEEPSTVKATDEIASATPNNTATHMDDRGAHIHGKLDERLSVLVLEAGIIFHSLRKSSFATASQDLLHD
jgi:zinc transporter 1/2/3